MSEPVFDIAFYGIIQSGKDKDTVIENMASLFKTTPDRVRPYFAGGRKVVKSGVDELTAEKYRAALENVGLVIKIEEVEAAPDAEADSADESQDAAVTESGDDPGVAPVGADLLENPPVVEAQPIGDISGITLADVGADVLENPPQVEPRPIGDISDITLAEAGADVIENPKPVEAAPLPDISSLSVEDR